MGSCGYLSVCGVLGTSIVGYNTPHRPVADSFLFCRHAGFETNDELEAYEFLRNLSAEEITKAFKSAMEWTVSAT